MTVAPPENVSPSLPRTISFFSGVDRHDVERLLRGDPEPFALPDRVPQDPLVVPQEVPFPVHEAPVVFADPPALEETGVGVVGDEADVLALPLLVHRQPRAEGDLPHLLLHHLPHGEPDPPQPVGVERIEEVRLVLPGVRRGEEAATPVGLRADDRVMPRGDPFRPQLVGLAQQRAEFHMLVAQDARVRRAARLVLPDERVDHLPAEFVPQVEDVVRDPQGVAHAPGVVQVVQRAARPLAIPRHGRIVVEVHRDADDLPPVPLQEQRRHGGVDPPAHRRQNPSLRHCAFAFCGW